MENKLAKYVHEVMSIHNLPKFETIVEWFEKGINPEDYRKYVEAYRALNLLGRLLEKNKDGRYNKFLPYFDEMKCDILGDWEWDTNSAIRIIEENDLAALLPNFKEHKDNYLNFGGFQR